MRALKFAIPEIIFGHSSIEHLAQCALRLGASRTLLVSDVGLEDAGWVEKVMDTLKAEGLEWVYFNDVCPNPRDSQVHKGAELYLESKADVVIALGGGSAMDTAKGISTIVGNGGNICDYEGTNRIMRPLPPMIFIPTTAGSGSDISQFSIITDMQRMVKMSIISRSLVPNISIIDPEILATKTPDLIATSAIDALAHAIESYVSLLASPYTENLALRAIELIMKHLVPALETRSMYHLEQLSIASTSAGMSFSNASLGAGHALAHSLGGVFDVQHGHVHPILLPKVMKFNMEACMEKMSVIGKIVLGPSISSQKDMAERGIQRLEEYFAKLGVVTRLRDLVPDDSKLAPISRVALLDACMLTNPRQASEEDLLGVCREAW